MPKHAVISSRQIKAARALLDWSQEDLASSSGLSIATIRKIESGALSPRDKTMGAIVSALEEANIEFTDSTGVRLKDQNVTVIEGDDCFLRLVDEIYYAMSAKGGEVLFVNGDDSKMSDAEWDAFIRLRKAGIRFRVLVKEGNTNLHLPLDEYRWVPSKFYRYNVLGIFQNKVAISVYGKNTDVDMQKALIIGSDALAECMRGLFEFMWENCRKPTLTTAPQVFE